MPQTMTVTAPNGKTLDITGDHVPSEGELQAIFKAAGVGVSAPTLAPFSARGGATNADMVSPETPQAPKESTGAKLGRAALDSLPGVGAIVGGALSTPETLGTGTIAGAALGAGAGRGLRDVLSEMFGFEGKTGAVSKATRIALDVGETAALSAVIPGLIEAAKSPGQTIKGLMELLPARLRPAIPPALQSAPARILERPSWQTWEQNLPKPTDAEPAAAPRATGTSMTPSPMPQPRPAAAVAPETANASPASISEPAAPVAQPASDVPQPQASQPAPKPMSPQQTLNEVALARQRANATRSPQPYRANMPTADKAAMMDRVAAGEKPQDAIDSVMQQRVKAESERTLPQGARSSSRPLSRQQTLNELALAARRAKISLNGEDYGTLQVAVRDGMTPVEAVAALAKARMSPIEQLAGSGSFAGLPSEADVAAAVTKRNNSGQWKPPTADARARWEAAREKQ